MSDRTPVLPLTPADHRRAAALTVHYGRGDVDGVQAVTTEAVEEHRSLALIFALLALNDQIVPAVYTELGLQFVSNYVVTLAGMEEQ